MTVLTLRSSLHAEAQRDFFIDLKVKPYAGKQGMVQPRSDDPDGDILAGDVLWMREKWRELMVKFYGQEPSPMASPEKPPGMDDVVAEMRQRLKVRTHLISIPWAGDVAGTGSA